MSTNKYADLPDIDTAPDIYETEDVEPSSETIDGDVSEEETPQNQRTARRQEPSKEEIDFSSLIDTDEATKHFKRAERRRNREATYTLSSSPTRTYSPVRSGPTRPQTLSQRLRYLQNELVSLETELSDPSNPLLAKEREEENVDPGELIRGVVDVRARLDRIRKEKEGRGKLVGVILNNGGTEDAVADKSNVDKEDNNEIDRVCGQSQIRLVTDMDRRVGDLEKLVGSASATLDESSLLPPPLLPLIPRLNAQLNLLTQPRHIDSISRRLKLLVTELDRVASHQMNAHRRQQSQPQAPPTPIPPQIHEQLTPLLTRLGPLLPQIPHILIRLRSLATLHASASDFQDTIRTLTAEHQKVHDILNDIQKAVTNVEKVMEQNRDVVKENVTGLESRIDTLNNRIEELSRTMEN